jgi:hypothetical protein
MTVEPTNAPTSYRTHFRILNNSSDTIGVNQFIGTFRLNDVDDVIISGNSQTFAPPLPGTHWITRAINIQGSNNIDVRSNNFPGLMRVLETHYLNSHLTAPAAARARVFLVADGPTNNEPPLLIGAEKRWVANAGVSGTGPYRVELNGALSQAYPTGTPVVSAPTTNYHECQNDVTTVPGVYIDGLC